MFLNCFLIEDICLINSKQPEKTIKVLQRKKKRPDKMHNTYYLKVNATHKIYGTKHKATMKQAQLPHSLMEVLIFLPCINAFQISANVCS